MVNLVTPAQYLVYIIWIAPVVIFLVAWHFGYLTDPDKPPLGSQPSPSNPASTPNDEKTSNRGGDASAKAKASGRDTAGQGAGAGGKEAQISERGKGVLNDYIREIEELGGGSEVE